MPLGLALFVDGHPAVLDAATVAALAAARSSVRRSGHTLAAAWSAAGACRRNLPDTHYDRGAAAAWFRAEAVARSVGWPGDRAPAGVRLALATWSPGALRAARRLGRAPRNTVPL